MEPANPVIGMVQNGNLLLVWRGKTYILPLNNMVQASIIAEAVNKSIEDYMPAKDEDDV